MDTNTYQPSQTSPLNTFTTDMDPQHPSRLMALPLELRIEIFTYLLPDVPVIPSRYHTDNYPYAAQFHSQRVPGTDHYKALRKDGCSCWPSVLRTCQQIFLECSSIILSPLALEVRLERHKILLLSTVMKGNELMANGVDILQRLLRGWRDINILLEIPSRDESGSFYHQTSLDVFVTALRSTATCETLVINLSLYRSQLGQCPLKAPKFCEEAFRILDTVRGLKDVQLITTKSSRRRKASSSQNNLLKYISGVMDRMKTTSSSKEPPPLVELYKDLRDDFSSIHMKECSEDILQCDWIDRSLDEAWTASHMGDLRGFSDILGELEDHWKGVIAEMKRINEEIIPAINWRKEMIAKLEDSFAYD